MAKQKQWVQVDKRKLEISNLDKVLFPEDGIVKAQVIEYYLSIAPTLLRHVKNRALTLIRFPDGIHGEMFYQKNRPEWAPDWIEFAELGSEEKKDYIVATEPALLVWLANLAALELHQIHSRKPHFDKPDYMVFDLDPPEGYSFGDVIDLSLRLKTRVEAFGYTPFVKTTGGKGVHICCPLMPHHSFHDVFEAAQAVAQPFVDANAKETTLHIKKDARKGRVLIDIYLPSYVCFAVTITIYVHSFFVDRYHSKSLVYALWFFFKLEYRLAQSNANAFCQKFFGDTLAASINCLGIISLAARVRAFWF